MRWILALAGFAVLLALAVVGMAYAMRVLMAEVCRHEEPPVELDRLLYCPNCLARVGVTAHTGSGKP